MDTHIDFKPFRDLIDELSAALRAGFKADDAMVRAYWDALKDVSLGEVRANVKRIIATATKETGFPKPRDLRNKPPVIAPTLHDPKRDAAQRLNDQTWSEMKARDPVTYQIEVGIARAARELLALDPADPDHEAVARQFQRWTQLRYARRAEQEAVIAGLGGA